MPKDPICGMEVSISSPLHLNKGTEDFYFCSEHCLKKFAQQNDIKEIPTNLSPKKWYLNKVILICILIALLCLLSSVFPILIPFRESFLMYFKKVWWAILLGLLIGGMIDQYFAHEYISHLLAQRKKRTIKNAVVLGFLMSVCNHGILAISIELYKKGASTSAVIAFLLASPWANLPITLMLIGFFGVAKALYIILSAILIAFTTGFIFQFLETKHWIEINPRTLTLHEDFSLIKDLKIRMKGFEWTPERLKKDAVSIKEGTLALADMVLWWMLVGVAMASLSAAYIPAHVFHQYLGPTALGLVITLIAATLIEVCSEGMSPLAFEIYRQTGAVGNSLVFLMAGVATDYTEIGLIWQNIGPRAAIWLPIITVPQIILLGVIANIIF
jgi:uncharacterized membrane protein YraQ (UPF0718 family)/YHS domain-containing protein